MQLAGTNSLTGLVCAGVGSTIKNNFSYEENFHANREIRSSRSGQWRCRQINLLVTRQTGNEDWRHRTKVYWGFMPQHRLLAEQECCSQREGRVLLLEKRGIWNQQGQLPD